MKSLLVILVLGAILLGLWQATYPDPYDPKGIHYVLWKHHLAPMDIGRVDKIVTHDRDRDSMMLGHTKAELARRFGDLKTPSEVTPYFRDFCWAARPGSDAMFLGGSDLMIVFTKGRATEVVTCEG